MFYCFGRFYLVFLMLIVLMNTNYFQDTKSCKKIQAREIEKIKKLILIFLKEKSIWYEWSYWW
jgi:hypothetical protein